MKCNNCNSEMIEGVLSLKAIGSTILSLSKSSAELSFNKEVVMKSKQGFFGYQRKAEHEAHFCKNCSSITFKLKEK